MNNGFKRSININFDIDTNVINDYILTLENKSILIKLFETMRSNSNEKSVILSGVYGAGKSYLVTLFSTLLVNGIDKFKKKYFKLYKKLIEDEQLAEFLKSPIMASENLYIPLYGDNQNLLDELKSNLKKYFEIQFPSEIGNLIKLIDEKLEQNSKYLLILFDEFSQFLENNINNPKNINVQLLQQLAEYVNNSNRISFILVSHKEIARYTNILGADLKDEWQKIDGRFVHFHLKINKTLAINLLLNILQENSINTKRLKAFKQGAINPTNKSSWIQEVTIRNYYNELQELIKNENFDIIWPLHPLSIICLPILSAEVGQSNRSITSFIYSLENNSAKSWIDDYLTNLTQNKEYEYRNSVIQLDILWDYFETAIKNDIGYGGYAEIWKLVHNHIKFLKYVENNVILIKIVKIIAILNITLNYTNIYPTKENIIFALSIFDKLSNDYELYLDRLIELHLLRIHPLTKVYELYVGSGINWTDKINELLQTKIITPANRLKILQTNIKLEPFISRRYSLKYRINRYLYPLIINEKITAINDINWLELFEKYDFPDGIMVYLPFTNKQERSELIKYLKEEFNELENIVFVIPNKELKINDLLNTIFIINILLNKDDIRNDLKKISELEVIKEINLELLQNETNDFFAKYKNATIIIKNKPIPDHNTSSIDKELNDIFEKIYAKTPIINFEMFVGNHPSPTMKAQMKEFIKKIFNTKMHLSEVMVKNAAHEVLYRILVNKETQPFITNMNIEFDNKNHYKQIVKFYDDKPDKVNYKVCIDDMISDLKSDKAINLKNLLYKYKKEPYGLRNSVFNIMLLLAIHYDPNVEFLVSPTTSDEYQLLTSDVFTEVVFDNNEYKIITRKNDITIKKLNRKLIDKIDKIINQLNIDDDNLKLLINETKKQNIITTTDIKRIIKYIYYLLPNFSKRTNKYINTETKLFRDTFYSFVNNTLLTADYIIGEKSKINIDKIEIYFNEIFEIIYKLEKDIITIFFKQHKLNNNITNAKEVKNKMFYLFKYYTEREISLEDVSNFNISFSDPRKNNLLNLMKTIIITKNIEYSEISKLISIHYTSLEPKDWDDETISKYKQLVKEDVELLSRLKNNPAKLSTLKYLSSTNQLKSIHFQKNELSNFGKIILKNLKTQIDLGSNKLSENEITNILNELMVQIYENKNK